VATARLQKQPLWRSRGCDSLLLMCFTVATKQTAVRFPSEHSGGIMRRSACQAEPTPNSAYCFSAQKSLCVPLFVVQNREIHSQLHGFFQSRNSNIRGFAFLFSLSHSHVQFDVCAVPNPCTNKRLAEGVHRKQGYDDARVRLTSERILGNVARTKFHLLLNKLLFIYSDNTQHNYAQVSVHNYCSYLWRRSTHTALLQVNGVLQGSMWFGDGLLENSGQVHGCVLFVCMYVCMNVYMYVCMYVCMYVRMYVCTMYVRMYVRTYVCMYVRMYVCTYVRMYVCTMYDVCMYVCMYVCVCMYACMYVIYIYMSHIVLFLSASVLLVSSPSPLSHSPLIITSRLQ
jgi:hypothetical protein